MTRSVLVTGGSQGIGLAIARACEVAGWSVTVLSRRPPAEQGTLAHLPCDLRDAQLASSTLQRWLAADPSRVDAVIHCAVTYGSSSRHPIAESTVEEWEAAMQVNARGLLLVLQQVVPRMTARGHGTVIGMSSVVAGEPAPGRIPYAASKAAAHAVLAGLAAEVAGTGVCVLELAPLTQVDTPGIRSRRPKDFEPHGYAAADSFTAPVLRLLGAEGIKHHGRCLWVDPGGQLCNREGTVIA